MPSHRSTFILNISYLLVFTVKTNKNTELPQKQKNLQIKRGDLSPLFMVQFGAPHYKNDTGITEVSPAQSHKDEAHDVQGKTERAGLLYFTDEN